MMVLRCQLAPGGAECSCMVPAPAPAPHIYTDGDGQLWHRYTAVCCGAYTRSVHMHTICTHCAGVFRWVWDCLCRRFQLCREAVLLLPQRIVRSKCRAAAASPWTRWTPPPSPPSPWTPPWWPPAPATRSSSWTSTGPWSSFRWAPANRASNEGSRRFQNHGEGPYDGYWLKAPTSTFTFKTLDIKTST